MHIQAQALEEVDKALGLLPEVVQLLMDVVGHKAVGHAVQLLVRDGGEAAPLLRLPGAVFQHIVHEGADLRRLEAGGLIGLGPQAVLAEIGIAAGGKAVDA